MLADAKKAGVHAILLTDHYRPPRDFIDGRWRGLKDGVLFVPGSEVRGFLVYPEKSILNRMDLKGADFVDTVTAGDGLIFLSHIEERKDHPVDGLTGLEIYNRHYDAKRDKAVAPGPGADAHRPQAAGRPARRPLRLYPDEVLAFQCDYPDGLPGQVGRGDEAAAADRASAANDCHHNQVLLVKMVDADTVLIGTNVDADDKMRKVTADAAARHQGDDEGAQGRATCSPGWTSTRTTARSATPARTSSAPKLDEPAVRAALKAGHAYVAHDWMCDATGFRFEAADPAGQGGRRHGRRGEAGRRPEADGQASRCRRSCGCCGTARRSRSPRARPSSSSR